jgi:ferrochelatase
MSTEAVLLLNLGSPDSPEIPDVRKYLKEFLSDKRVLDTPAPIRQFVLNVFILPRRPRNSAEAYRKIWTPQGSPLIVISKRVQSLLQKKIDIPIELAMRYGKPSTDGVLKKMIAQGIQKIYLIPLYPHYAMSSYETAVVKVQEVLAKIAPGTVLKTLPPFYEDPEYIKAMVSSSEDFLKKSYDHLLFSFHGIPERHLKQADPSKCHCLIQSNCCSTPNPVHDFCYRAHAFKTVRAFVEKAKIPEAKYSVSFQSRLGREPWLKPYTDFELKEFPSRGIKRLLVICPAFVSDCLETLEEIAMRGKEIFMEAGGEEFHQIPCLNDHPLWIEALESYVKKLRSK